MDGAKGVPNRIGPMHLGYGNQIVKLFLSYRQQGKIQQFLMLHFTLLEV